MDNRNKRRMPYLPRYTPLSSRRPTFVSSYSALQSKERVMYIGGSPSRVFSSSRSENFSSPTRTRKIYLHSTSLRHYLTRITESPSCYDVTSSHLYTYEDCLLGTSSVLEGTDQTGSSEKIQHKTSYCPDITLSESGVGESEYGSELGWDEDSVSQNSLDSWSTFCETTLDSELYKWDNENECGYIGDRKKGHYNNNDMDQRNGVRNRGHRHPEQESLTRVNNCKNMPPDRESDKVNYLSSPGSNFRKIHITSSTLRVSTAQTEPSAMNVDYAGKVKGLESITLRPLSQPIVSVSLKRTEVPNLIISNTGDSDESHDNVSCFNKTNDVQLATIISAFNLHRAYKEMVDQATCVGSSCNNSCSDDKYYDIADRTVSCPASDKTPQIDAKTSLSDNNICDNKNSYKSSCAKSGQFPCHKQFPCDGTSSGRENGNNYQSRQTTLTFLIPPKIHTSDEIRRKAGITGGVRKSPGVEEKLGSEVTLKKHEHQVTRVYGEPDIEFMDRSMANTPLVRPGKHPDDKPREVPQTSTQAVGSPEEFLTQSPSAETAAWEDEIREVSLSDHKNTSPTCVHKAKESQLNKSVRCHRRKCHKRRFDDDNEARLPDYASVVKSSVFSNSLHTKCECNHSFRKRPCFVTACVNLKHQMNGNAESKKWLDMLFEINNKTVGEVKRNKNTGFCNRIHNVSCKYIDGSCENSHRENSEKTDRKVIYLTNVDTSDENCRGNKSDLSHFSDRTHSFSSPHREIQANHVTLRQECSRGYTILGSRNLNETYSVCNKFVHNNRKLSDSEMTTDLKEFLFACVNEPNVEECSLRRSGCYDNTLKQSDSFANASRKSDSYNTLRQSECYNILRQSDSCYKTLKQPYNYDNTLRQSYSFDNTLRQSDSCNNTLRQSDSYNTLRHSKCYKTLRPSDSFERPDNSRKVLQSLDSNLKQLDIQIQSDCSENPLRQSDSFNNVMMQSPISDNSLRQSDTTNADKQRCPITVQQPTDNTFDLSQSDSVNGTISNSWKFPEIISEQRSGRKGAIDLRPGSNILRTNENEHPGRLSVSNRESEYLLFCETNNVDLFLADTSGSITFHGHHERNEALLTVDTKDKEIIRNDVNNKEHQPRPSAIQTRREVSQQLANSTMLSCGIIGSYFNSDISFFSDEWTTPSLNVNNYDKDGDDLNSVIINQRNKRVYMAQENRIDFYREIPATILVKSITLSRDVQSGEDKGIREAGHFRAARMGVAFVEIGDELTYDSELVGNQASTSSQNIQCKPSDETVNSEDDKTLNLKEHNTELGIHVGNDSSDNSVNVVTNVQSSEVVVQGSCDNVTTNTSIFYSILDVENVSLDHSLFNDKSITLCRPATCVPVTLSSRDVKEEIDKFSPTTEAVSITSLLSPTLLPYQTTADISTMKENRFSLSLKHLISSETDLSSSIVDSFVTNMCPSSPLDDLQAQLSMISGDAFCGRTESDTYIEHIVYQDCGQATTKQENVRGGCIDIVKCLDIAEKLEIKEESSQKPNIYSKTGKWTEPYKDKIEFPREQYDNDYDYDYLRSDSSTGSKLFCRPHHQLHRLKCGMLKASSLWTLIEEPETVTDEISVTASPKRSVERQTEEATAPLKQQDVINKEVSSFQTGSTICGQTNNTNCGHNSFVTASTIADGSNEIAALFGTSRTDGCSSGICEQNQSPCRETESLVNIKIIYNQNTTGHDQVSNIISGHDSQNDTPEIINSSRICFSDIDLSLDHSDTGSNSVSENVDHGLLILDKLSMSLAQFNQQDEDLFDEKCDDCANETNRRLLDESLTQHCQATLVARDLNQIGGEFHEVNTLEIGSSSFCPHETDASCEVPGCVYVSTGVAEVMQNMFSDYDNVPISLKATTESSQIERTTPLNKEKLINNIATEQSEDLVNERNAETHPAKEISQIKPGEQLPGCSITNYEVLCTAFINDDTERNQNHACITVEDKHLSIFRFKRFLKKSHSKRKNGRRVLKFFSKLMCISENTTSPIGSPCAPRKMPNRSAKSMSSYKQRISNPVLVTSTSIHHQDILNSSIDGSTDDGSSNQSSSTQSLDSTPSRADSAYSSITESAMAAHNSIENQSAFPCPFHVSSDTQSLISESFLSFASCGSSSHYTNISSGSLDSTLLQTGNLISSKCTFDNSDSLEQNKNSHGDKMSGEIDTALLNTLRYGHKQVQRQKYMN